MKYAILIAVMLSLFGCGKGENHMGDVSWSSIDFEIICLDGVQYYGRLVGDKVYFAPRFDKDTKEVALCFTK